MTKASCPFAIGIGRTMGLGGIFNNQELMIVSKLQYLLHW